MLSLSAAFLLFGTNMLMAQDAATGAAAASCDATQCLAGAAYYVLLFVIVCFVVGIVGKILRVYDLTQQIQNKKGINWHNVMGAVCLIFLVAGLYGAYWSFTVQGAMILPISASEHGIKIDEMFWTTTVFTMIVFVITQILLFGFLFLTVIQINAVRISFRMTTPSKSLDHCTGYRFDYIGYLRFLHLAKNHQYT
jgi:cytochrome c oxidase subunit 2